MKISSIFSDYDGTRCPLELRREEAYVSPRPRRLLAKISKAAFGVVTTKNLAFIRDKVPFAQGIDASCGLEFQVGEVASSDERFREPNRKLEKVYNEALTRILQIRYTIVIERKEADDGKLPAFCIDWRLSRNWDEARRKAAPVLASCKEGGSSLLNQSLAPSRMSFQYQWTRVSPCRS